MTKKVILEANNGQALEIFTNTFKGISFLHKSPDNLTTRLLINLSPEAWMELRDTIDGFLGFNKVSPNTLNSNQQ